MADRNWFITGASRGFGRAFTRAALAAGDRVAATARDTSSLDDLATEHGDALVPIELDVTDHDAAFVAVRHAHDRLGRLDVILNNAGYGVSGAVEELTEEQARRQIEVNLFGALWVTQAALPFLREQGSGWIVQVSSIGGLAAFPLTGIYHASKWALEGLSESLRQEVEPFGIKVLMVEPSGFRTDWAGSSMDRADPIDAIRASRRSRSAGQASRRRTTVPNRAIPIVPRRPCSPRSTATTRRFACCSATSPTTSPSIATSRD
jgi:NAD(P)-dependent dehydrogenase (short-subunit alcohol dehydrogenase family)